MDQAHGAGPGLIQSGKQYASRVAQKSKKIRESTRTLQTLQGVKESGLKVSLFFFQNFLFECKVAIVFFVLQSDPNEPNGPDIDSKIDEIKNQLRRSEVLDL